MVTLGAGWWVQPIRAMLTGMAPLLTLNTVALFVTRLPWRPQRCPSAPNVRVRGTNTRRGSTRCGWHLSMTWGQPRPTSASLASHSSRLTLVS